MAALLVFKSLCVLTEGDPHWRHAMLCLGMWAWYIKDVSVEKTVPHVDFIIMFMSDSLMGSVLSSCVYSQFESFTQLYKQKAPANNAFKMIPELNHWPLLISL